jgi:hypothetical protein
MTNRRVLMLCLYYFTENSSMVCLHGPIIPCSLAWKEEEYSIREEVVGISVVVSGLLILHLCMLSPVGSEVLKLCSFIRFKF